MWRNIHLWRHSHKTEFQQFTKTTTPTAATPKTPPPNHTQRATVDQTELHPKQKTQKKSRNKRTFADIVCIDFNPRFYKSRFYGLSAAEKENNRHRISCVNTSERLESLLKSGRMVLVLQKDGFFGEFLGVRQNVVFSDDGHSALRWSLTRSRIGFVSFIIRSSCKFRWLDRIWVNYRIRWMKRFFGEENLRWIVSIDSLKG